MYSELMSHYSVKFIVYFGGRILQSRAAGSCARARGGFHAAWLGGYWRKDVVPLFVINQERPISASTRSMCAKGNKVITGTKKAFKIVRVRNVNGESSQALT